MAVFVRDKNATKSLTSLPGSAIVATVGDGYVKSIHYSSPNITVHTVNTHYFSLKSKGKIIMDPRDTYYWPQHTIRNDGIPLTTLHRRLRNLEQKSITYERGCWIIDLGYDTRDYGAIILQEPVWDDSNHEWWISTTRPWIDGSKELIRQAELLKLLHSYCHLPSGPDGRLQIIQPNSSTSSATIDCKASLEAQVEMAIARIHLLERTVGHYQRDLRVAASGLHRRLKKIEEAAF